MKSQNEIRTPAGGETKIPAPPAGSALLTSQPSNPKCVHEVESAQIPLFRQPVPCDKLYPEHANMSLFSCHMSEMPVAHCPTGYSSTPRPLFLPSRPAFTY